MQNLMKIRSAALELLHASRRMEKEFLIGAPQGCDRTYRQTNLHIKSICFTLNLYSIFGSRMQHTTLFRGYGCTLSRFAISIVTVWSALDRSWTKGEKIPLLENVSGPRNIKWKSFKIISNEGKYLKRKWKRKTRIRSKIIYFNTFLFFFI
jgi:hypothetical protein